MVIAEVISKERLDRYVLEAAKVADYEEGFGVTGCDLNLGHWWVAYTRQSTRSLGHDYAEMLV